MTTPEALIARFNSAPQRVADIDSGELADEYRISVSASERATLIAALSRPAPTPAEHPADEMYRCIREVIDRPASGNVLLHAERDKLAAIKCRYGCDSPVVGLFSTPEGCLCWPDQMQALCAQHACTIAGGPVVCVVDFKNFTNAPAAEVTGERGISVTLIPQLEAMAIEFCEGAFKEFGIPSERLRTAYVPLIVKLLEHAVMLATPSPDAGRVPEDALNLIKDKIDSVLNDHLCEMKPFFDDSIVGFNEAWDIVRKVFADAASPAHDEVKS